jgi:hypothetical protein
MVGLHLPSTGIHRVLKAVGGICGIISDGLKTLPVFLKFLLGRFFKTSFWAFISRHFDFVTRFPFFLKKSWMVQSGALSVDICPPKRFEL